MQIFNVVNARPFA